MASLQHLGVKYVVTIQPQARTYACMKTFEGATGSLWKVLNVLADHSHGILCAYWLEDYSMFGRHKVECVEHVTHEFADNVLEIYLIIQRVVTLCMRLQVHAIS